MFFSRNHIIILIVLLLVAISTSFITKEGFSQNALIKDPDGLSADLTGKKCKNISSSGFCLPTEESYVSTVNKLNNSIMNFYDNNNDGVKKNTNMDSYPYEGQDELYILKSQIIPPICPVCPTGIPCKNKIKKKCQPCPPCAKCPEPSFDCKKVPNYSSTRNMYLPRAILTDEFTQYGM